MMRSDNSPSNASEKHDRSKLPKPPLPPKPKADVAENAPATTSPYPDVHFPSWHANQTPAGSDPRASGLYPEVVFPAPGSPSAWRQPPVFIDENSNHESAQERPLSRWVATKILVFDVLPMSAEMGVILWQAVLLWKEGFRLQFALLVIAASLPSVINATYWFMRSKRDNDIHENHLLHMLLLIVPPSPVAFFIYHIVIIFRKQLSSQCYIDISQGTVRLIKAMFSSVPFLFVNVITLINILRSVDEKDASKEVLHIGKLQEFKEDVYMHGFIIILTTYNFLRAVCIFNERRTRTVLFVLVAFPFLVLLTCIKLLALNVIIAFFPALLSLFVIGACVLLHLILYVICKKSIYHKLRRKSKLLLVRYKGKRSNSKTAQNDVVFDHVGNDSHVSNRLQNDDDVDSVSTEDNEEYCFLFSALCKIFTIDNLRRFFFSLCSVIVPVAYTNDPMFKHPRIKGGMFLILYFLLNSVIIFPVLSYTILHHVPHAIHGITTPSRVPISIHIPETKIAVNIKPIGVNINIPNPATNITLDDIPQFDLQIVTEQSIHTQMLILSLLFITICLPFVIMRALFMELDLKVIREKHAHVMEVSPADKHTHTLLRHRDYVHKYSTDHSHPHDRLDRGLQLRTYCALTCTPIAAIMFVLFIIICTGAVYISVP